ncbi:MAG: ethyl tert-butyl ether degradation protein EthD [Burkholderiaceae bacterium]
MRFCYFLTIHSDLAQARTAQAVESFSTDRIGNLLAMLTTLGGLTQARVHKPASAHDPMLDDGAPPALVLQLFFDEINPLETQLKSDSPLANILSAQFATQMAEASIDQQVMLCRPYPVAGPPQPSGDARQPHCTYLVRYLGPAQDMNAWMSDYLSGHPRLMAQLPGIRRLEIFSRIDWCGSLPWFRATDMQRNQVVFDSPDALNKALNSPLRVQMREHYNALPPFEGAVTHFPMRTWQACP